MRPKKAIITAAGFGSRFLPITKTIPKELLPVIDKPIVHWVVEECVQAGIEEIYIVTAPDEVKTFEDYFYGHAENIKELLFEQGKKDRWEKVKSIFKLPKITIIPENRKFLYGNGRPLLTVKRKLKHDDCFLVCFGDDLTLCESSFGAKQICDFFENANCDLAMLVTDKFSGERLTKGGVLKIKEGTTNEVERVIEKPSIDKLPSNLYSFGRFVMTNEIFNYLKPNSTGKDNEIWLQDANDKVAENGVVKFKILDGEFITTGDPKEYLFAQNRFAARFLKD